MPMRAEAADYNETFNGMLTQKQMVSNFFNYDRIKAQKIKDNQILAPKLAVQSTPTID